MKRQTNWLVQMIEDKHIQTDYIEFLIAQLNLRLVDDLESGRKTVREAERLLYNLDVYIAIEKRKHSRKCREILEWGMQLEDVEEFKLDFSKSFEALRKYSNKILQKSSSKARPVTVDHPRKRTAVAA